MFLFLFTVVVGFPAEADTPNNLSQVPTGVVPGVGQVPTDIVSGVGQVTTGIVSGVGHVPTSIVSGVGQVPTDIISGVGQVPTGIVSGVGQTANISLSPSLPSISSRVPASSHCATPPLPPHTAYASPSFSNVTAHQNFLSQRPLPMVASQPLPLMPQTLSITNQSLSLISSSQILSSQPLSLTSQQLSTTTLTPTSLSQMAIQPLSHTIPMCISSSMPIATQTLSLTCQAPLLATHESSNDEAQLLSTKATTIFPRILSQCSDPLLPVQANKISSLNSAASFSGLNCSTAGSQSVDFTPLSHSSAQLSLSSSDPSKLTGALVLPISNVPDESTPNTTLAIHSHSFTTIATPLEKTALIPSPSLLTSSTGLISSIPPSNLISTPLLAPLTVPTTAVLPHPALTAHIQPFSSSGAPLTLNLLPYPNLLSDGQINTALPTAMLANSTLSTSLLAYSSNQLGTAGLPQQAVLTTTASIAIPSNSTRASAIISPSVSSLNLNNDCGTREIVLPSVSLNNGIIYDPCSQGLSNISGSSITNTTVSTNTFQPNLITSASSIKCSPNISITSNNSNRRDLVPGVGVVKPFMTGKQGTPAIVRPFELSLPERHSVNNNLIPIVSSVINSNYNDGIGLKLNPVTTSSSPQLFSDTVSNGIFFKSENSNFPLSVHDIKREVVNHSPVYTKPSTEYKFLAGNISSVQPNVWSPVNADKIYCKQEPMQVGSPAPGIANGISTVAAPQLISNSAFSSTFDTKNFFAKLEPISFSVSNLIPANCSVNVTTHPTSLHNTFQLLNGDDADKKVQFSTSDASICVKHENTFLTASNVLPISSLPSRLINELPGPTATLGMPSSVSPFLARIQPTTVNSPIPQPNFQQLQTSSPPSILNALPSTVSSLTSLHNSIPSNIPSYLVASNVSSCQSVTTPLPTVLPHNPAVVKSINGQFTITSALNTSIQHNAISEVQQMKNLPTNITILSQNLENIKNLNALAGTNMVSGFPQPLPNVSVAPGMILSNLSTQSNQNDKANPHNILHLTQGIGNQNMGASHTFTNMLLNSSEVIPNNSNFIKLPMATSNNIMQLASLPILNFNKMESSANEIMETSAGELALYASLSVSQPSQPPVSLLDLRAKQEAKQKEFDRIELGKKEDQCKILQEALKALEEAHQEQQQLSLTIVSPIKDEANIKKEIKTEIPRSRKEEIRIRKEGEKAAREEAKTRKEEAKLKREEGMRIIRSELKRKLIEERQISIVKKRITILHKGPSAPLAVTDEVSNYYVAVDIY